MPTRRHALTLLAALAIVAALVATLRAEPQGRSLPSRSRTPTYSDVLRRYLGKSCELRELPVPDTDKSLLVLKFNDDAPDAKPAAGQLTLSQIGDDFVVVESAPDQKILLPHGMVALFEKD